METAREKETRERKEKQASAVAALRRSKGGPTEVPAAIEETEITHSAGGSGVQAGTAEARKVLKGFKPSDQADALRAPIKDTDTKPGSSPSPKPVRSKTPSEMSDDELAEAAKGGNLAAASERNKRRNAGRK